MYISSELRIFVAGIPPVFLLDVLILVTINYVRVCN